MENRTMNAGIKGRAENVGVNIEDALQLRKGEKAYWGKNAWNHHQSSSGTADNRAVGEGSSTFFVTN